MLIEFYESSRSGATNVVAEMFDKSLSLYDSAGSPIATAHQDTLFAPDGAVVGLYLQNLRIFVDLTGDYLGEIVYGNRLLARQRPIHARAVCFTRPLPRAHRGTTNVLAMQHCRVAPMPGFGDVAVDRLGGKSVRAA